MAKAPVPDEPCCSRQQNYGVSQSPDEIEFARGLWQPAMEGNMERVKELLAKGFDVDSRDSAGYTPLLYAARNGHCRMCEILLDHGANVNACTRSIRATPLHRAASQSHPEIIDTLLRYGANANLTDVDGKTALHRAIPELSNRTENARHVCEKLLTVTDPTIKDNSGKTVQDVIEERHQNLNEQLTVDDIECRSLRDLSKVHRVEAEEMEKLVDEVDEDIERSNSQANEMKEIDQSIRTGPTAMKIIKLNKMTKKMQELRDLRNLRLKLLDEMKVMEEKKRINQKDIQKQ